MGAVFANLTGEPEPAPLSVFEEDERRRFIRRDQVEAVKDFWHLVGRDGPEWQNERRSAERIYDVGGKLRTKWRGLLIKKGTMRARSRVQQPPRKVGNVSLGADETGDETAFDVGLMLHQRLRLRRLLFTVFANSSTVTRDFSSSLAYSPPFVSLDHLWLETTEVVGRAQKCATTPATDSHCSDADAATSAQTSGLGSQPPLVLPLTTMNAWTDMPQLSTSSFDVACSSSFMMSSSASSFSVSPQAQDMLPIFQPVLIPPMGCDISITANPMDMSNIPFVSLNIPAIRGVPSSGDVLSDCSPCTRQRPRDSSASSSLSTHSDLF